MTHLELIELIYKYKNILNDAYIQKELESVQNDLVDINLLVKVANKYLLNQTYKKFVDSILDRVDYGIVFQDYIKEHNELIRILNRYKIKKSLFYKQEILKLIDDIYLKFLERDRQIKKRILDFYNDLTLDLEIIIEEANNILTQISELIDANSKILKTFNDLKKVDIEFKTRLVLLDEGFLKFIHNIDGYIKDLSKFINQTKTKRRQNKKFLKIANDILNERDFELNRFLEFNNDRFYHTIRYSRKNKIISYIIPEAKYLKTLLRSLKLQKTPKKIKEVKLKGIKKEKLDLVDIDKILHQLNKNKPDDLFIYLLKTTNKDVNEIFKIYLQLLNYKNIKYEKDFNSYNIRIVKWTI